MKKYICNKAHECGIPCIHGIPHECDEAEEDIYCESIEEDVTCEETTKE